MNAMQRISVQQNNISFCFWSEDRAKNVKLLFSKKPNHEAPEMISALLRKSYLKRMFSESRRFE